MIAVEFSLRLLVIACTMNALLGFIIALLRALLAIRDVRIPFLRVFRMVIDGWWIEVTSLPEVDFRPPRLLASNPVSVLPALRYHVATC